MSEIEQLKDRIRGSGPEGVLTAHIRDDYEPAGDMMMQQLNDGVEFVSRRTPMHSTASQWRMFATEFDPYQ